MSSVSVRLEGDTEELLEKIRQMEGVDKAGIANAVAEGLRTSTLERFREELSPEGERWTPSVRAQEKNGKTLTASAGLKNSIRAKSDDTGAAVGTNKIYAATHQFGDERTIRAKNKKNLTFRVGGRWISKPSVRVTIPARPFLGVSREDEEEIREILETVFEGDG